MVIKVQVTEVENGAVSDNIKYGIVVEPIDVEMFNMGSNEPLFDAELLAKKFVPQKTLVKYGVQAIRGYEALVTSKDGIHSEIMFHYIFPNEYIFEVKNLEDESS